MRVDLRNRLAKKVASRGDVRWFLDNPDRLHHVRASVPFERPEWDRLGHVKRPVMLARRVGTDLITWPLAGDLKGFPDEERFLALMWQHLEFCRDTQGERFQVSAESHLALLRMAGIETVRAA